MKKPRILVTSAGGHTGTPAVYQLLEKDYPVRACFHHDDIRADRFREAGAKVFIGNQLDYVTKQKTPGRVPAPSVRRPIMSSK